MKAGLLSLFLVITYSVLAQTFQKITYGVKEGLLTHLTKTVEMDSLGFIWLGTDEGLVRFDGKNFTEYPEATQSRYIKKIVSIDNELWVLSDLGLVKINSSPDTVSFERIIDGIRFKSDSLLLYPKDIYQDKEGRIWISEPGQIVLLNPDNSIKKFHLPEYSYSDSFFRSYTLFESFGDLYAVSFNGQFFHFDGQQFAELSVDSSISLSHINAVVNIQGTIFLGDRNGLHEVEIGSENAISVKHIKSVRSEEVSYIEAYDEETLLIGLFGNSIYLLDINDLSIKNQQEVFRVNDIHTSSDGDIWGASDEGAMLFKRNYFNRIPNQENYIESIWLADEAIYYCHKGGIYKLLPSENGYSQTTLIEDFNEYYISITGSGNDFWVSNRSSIMHFRDDKLLDRIDLDGRGFYVFDLLLDKKNRLWVNQDNTFGPLIINPDGTRTDFRESNIKGRIMVIKEGGNGKIYLGAVGAENYLYLFNELNEKFENLSLDLDVQLNNDFEVNDILVENDTVWLATNVGLFYQTDSIISRLNTGPNISNLPTKAIQKRGSKLWFSNSFGVIGYNIKTQEVLLFNESSGLNSRSGNAQALHIGEDGTKWVGTAKGLAYTAVEDKHIYATKKPLFTSAIYNTTKVRPSKLSDLLISNGAYLKINFLSTTMPGNSVIYQYKTSISDDWIDLGNVNTIEITGSSSGNYKYWVRAKQQGNYSWSEEASISFEVDIPTYLQPWFIGLSLISIFAAAALVYRYNRMRLEAIERHMNKIVDEKTEQIRAANEELKQINKELDMFVYSASHDMKAPLASLMGLLNIYDAETSVENRQNLIKMMRSSIQKLDAFLREIIDYSKNSRLGVSSDQVNIKELIQELLDSFQYLEEYKSVDIIVDDQVGTLVSDKNRIRIILNNLVSNSIRYMDPNKKKSWVKISVYKKERLYIEVEDNGVGIRSEHVDRIFEMFYRANEMKTGSGLGLYIVYESVRNLEGFVSVESEYGEGTKFTISIPLLD
jgi:signal transduction histidine kinase/ligand-binding sensor domain-containing protein